VSFVHASNVNAVKMVSHGSPTGVGERGQILSSLTKPN